MRTKTFLTINLLITLFLVVPLHFLLEYDFSCGPHEWCCCSIGDFRDGTRKFSSLFTSFIFWEILTMFLLFFSFSRFKKAKVSYIIAFLFPLWFYLILQRGYCFTEYGYTLFSIVFCSTILILCVKNPQSKEVDTISMFQRVFQCIAIFAFIGMSIFLQNGYVKGAIDYLTPRLLGRKTVEDVVKKYEPQVIRNFYYKNFITTRGFPNELVIIANKNKKELYVYGKMSTDKKYEHIADYPFMRMSGTLGPKLREGDGQIPEGIYEMESLNPNSRLHLSLRVNYPNEFDKQKAKLDGRSLDKLGGDIMIHGRSSTIGCIPIGDVAIEELFVMAAKAGVGNVKILILPCNLLNEENPPLEIENQPKWYPELLNNLRQEMLNYKKMGIYFQ